MPKIESLLERLHDGESIEFRREANELGPTTVITIRRMLATGVMEIERGVVDNLTMMAPGILLFAINQMLEEIRGGK